MPFNSIRLTFLTKSQLVNVNTSQHQNPQSERAYFYRPVISVILRAHLKIELLSIYLIQF